MRKFSGRRRHCHSGIFHSEAWEKLGLVCLFRKVVSVLFSQGIFLSSIYLLCLLQKWSVKGWAIKVADTLTCILIHDPTYIVKLSSFGLDFEHINNVLAHKMFMQSLLSSVGLGLIGNSDNSKPDPISVRRKTVIWKKKQHKTHRNSPATHAIDTHKTKRRRSHK